MNIKKWLHDPYIYQDGHTHTYTHIHIQTPKHTHGFKHASVAATALQVDRNTKDTHTAYMANK